MGAESQKGFPEAHVLPQTYCKISIFTSQIHIRLPSRFLSSSHFHNGNLGLMNRWFTNRPGTNSNNYLSLFGRHLPSLTVKDYEHTSYTYTISYILINFPYFPIIQMQFLDRSSPVSTKKPLAEPSLRYPVSQPHRPRQCNKSAPGLPWSQAGPGRSEGWVLGKTWNRILLEGDQIWIFRATPNRATPKASISRWDFPLYTIYFGVLPCVETPIS